MSEEACELIGEEYSKLRSHDFENSDLARTQPVTARALETLIRLSTAHAKARLSKTVDREDAETAIELVQVPKLIKTTIFSNTRPYPMLKILDGYLQQCTKS